MIEKKLIKEAIKEIENSKNILLTTHINPDADAIGSSLSLYNFLSKNFPDKELFFIIDGFCPDYLKFLKNSSKIKNLKDYSNNINFDLAIVLDCSTLDRIGNVKNLLKNIKIINVDHHLDDSKFDYVIKDVNSSSTSHILYYLLKEFKRPLSKEIGECLYVGLIQDTGNFIWNIYPETFDVAKKLISLGVNGEKISSQIYSKNSYNKLKLIAYALSNMIYLEGKKLLYSVIPNKFFKELNAKDEDTEGIIELLKTLDKADMTILMKEQENIKRVSIRSRKDGADKIAKIFGGGGHSKAAGFSTEKKVEEIIEIITKNI